VLVLRETILNTADSATLEALERRDEVYIAIVASGGYEYTVAMLAVLALGAAAVPITPALPVEEAAYFVDKSKSALVLVSSFDMKKCCDLEKRIASTSNEHFRGIPIGPCTYTPTLDPADIVISSDRPLEENAPGVVIFTSGTTGPPKGAVMRRSFVFDCALSVADHYRLTEDDVMLHVLPVHHATGVGINFFPFLISGSRVDVGAVETGRNRLPSTAHFLLWSADYLHADETPLPAHSAQLTTERVGQVHCGSEAISCLSLWNFSSTPTTERLLDDSHAETHCPAVWCNRVWRHF
jgi:acyl-CoA synthetase (AMP-forming)/AMP-acid ligase II